MHSWNAWTALKASRRMSAAKRSLRGFRKGAKSRGDLREWRRASAILRYIDGASVITIAAELEVTRGSVTRWLQWYNQCGLDGIRTVKQPGRPPCLSPTQRAALERAIEDGPQACCYTSGVWTSPMICDMIRERFGVTYHVNHIPRLLHKMGFSVQRPRKRLARADTKAQEFWIKKTFPAIKKKRGNVEA